MKYLSPRKSLGERPKVNWERMSTVSPLDVFAHQVTEVKLGNHSYSDQNLFRLMNLLLELSESFLVKFSLNKILSQFSKNPTLDIWSLQKSDQNSSLFSILLAENLLAWFSQNPPQTSCLPLGIYQLGNTLLLSCEYLPPGSVELERRQMLGYPCLYCHHRK